MAIAKFKYEVNGRERIDFQRLKDDDNLIYLGTKEWKAEGLGGMVDAYLITPGFYVELFSGSIVPIEVVGEESRESEFISSLENKLGIKIQRK